MLKNLLIFSFIYFALACQPKTSSPDTSPASTNSSTLSVYIWSHYLPASLIEEFQKQTGIQVKITTYASNEELLSKLQAGATGYDLILPSDYMVEIMVQLKLLQALNKELIPNFKNYDPHFLNPSYDSQNTYTVPYAWSTTGIAINRNQFKGEIKGWKSLFSNPSLYNKYSLLDDAREVIGAAFKLQGHSINSTQKEHYTGAQTYLKSIKKNVRAFSSEPIDAISKGDFWVSQMYSTDALQARAKGAPIEFVIPEEGTAMAIDNFAIPQTAKNIPAAHAFINFMANPQVHQKLVENIFVGPVIKNVQNLLPADLQKDKAIFPDASTLKKCEILKDIGSATTLMDQLWTELKVSE